MASFRSRSTFAVLDLTGSAADLGLVLATGTVTLLGALLFGGVVADRVSRRTVMIGADVVRLIGQATIGALLVTGHAGVPAIAASQGLLGAATGFFNPASSGLLPAVAGEHLQQANALRGIAMAAGGIGGPALGGVLVVTVGPGPALLIDAGTKAASTLLLAGLRVGRPVGGSARPGFLVDLREGFSGASVADVGVVDHHRGVVREGTFGIAFPVLGAVVAKESLGGAGAWATLLVARAIGLFAGGTILLRAEPRRPLLAAVPACAAAALPLLLLALAAPLALIGVAAAIAGLGAVIFNTLWETTLQEQVPARARSRVSSYESCLVRVARPPAARLCPDRAVGRGPRRGRRAVSLWRPRAARDRPAARDPGRPRISRPPMTLAD